MAFNREFEKRVDNFELDHLITLGGYLEYDCDANRKLAETYYHAIEKGAMFDARVFNIPKEEVTNLLYWRQLDATRNSIQMVGQANFSHKQLHGKSCNMIQDMLLTERGINWNDYPTHQKRGSCCVKSGTTITGATVLDNGEVETTSIERTHWYIDDEIPIFKGEGREYIDKLIFI
jgi:tRNA(His) 5'-end guanylyltransferase